MVIRFVVYEATSRQAAEEWAREHADLPREVPGLEEVTFVRSRTPPLVGAVMVFASADALARYKETGPVERLVDSLRKRWAGGDQPVREEAYRVMEI